MSSREKQYNVLKLRLYPTSEQAELFEKTFG
ncbi:helix-turn-helix domain-containing protein, partial [Flavonifractor plautii]